MRALFAFTMSGLLVSAVAVAAAPAFDKTPPGAIVQNVSGYPQGEGMGMAWHAVASRILVGKQNGKDPAYQWYLSFYKPVQPGASNALKLVYRAPGPQAGDVLAKVTKANGAQLYFPLQTLRIAGAGEFEKQDVQDFVVVTHESAADCGSSAVTIFGAAPSGNAFVKAQLTNGCDLQASIVKNGSLQAIKLTGPYYSKTAALCCPTKPNATAMLTYANGSWKESPSYFALKQF